MRGGDPLASGKTTMVNIHLDATFFAVETACPHFPVRLAAQGTISVVVYHCVQFQYDWSYWYSLEPYKR